jgi:ribosome-associated protein
MTNPTGIITPTAENLKTEKLLETIVSAAEDKKAGDISILKVSDICYLTDYFIILTGYSTTQVRAIGDEIEAAMELEWQQSPRQVEGKAEGSWILMDYGDIIVHIFLPKEREFYNLEAFWGHAQRIPLPSDHLEEQNP